MDIFCLYMVYVFLETYYDVFKGVDLSDDSIVMHRKSWLLLTAIVIPWMHILVFFEWLKKKSYMNNKCIIIVVIVSVLLGLSTHLYSKSHLKKSGYIYCPEPYNFVEKFPRYMRSKELCENYY